MNRFSSEREQNASSYILHHNILCPFSRYIRIMLAECNVNFKSHVQGNTFEHSQMDLSPILIVNKYDEAIDIPGTYAIIEYLQQEYNIFSTDIKRSSNARAICEIFNNQFYYEILIPIINEKVIKFYKDRTAPDSRILFAKQIEGDAFFKILNEILENKNCLSNDKLSVADFCVASHISCLDYFGMIPWNKWTLLRRWYSRIKSRPSFSRILLDKIPLINSAKHYAILDF
ncbi:glutathione S-transferase family protein [Candidatus Gromoviella agglomerans]|uniref:glutathione S-transferase family protein n=1 Tax=Candidatus Gromoviella agglomerans TaxID=2806609 RepID=UPI001E4BD26B|nr:glutathione S-transferase family protein [Candidatus Gromoviella agglomerans]UFX98620.1 Glutathione S-transferase family protein [Candidatus Gromoviella agglomerans]